MGRRLHLRVEAQLPTYSGCTDCGYTRRLQVEAQLEHPVVVAEQRWAHVRVGPAVGEVAVEGAGDDHHAAVVGGHLGERQPYAQERGGTWPRVRATGEGGG